MGVGFRREAGPIGPSSHGRTQHREAQGLEVPSPGGS